MSVLDILSLYVPKHRNYMLVRISGIGNHSIFFYGFAFSL